MSNDERKWDGKSRGGAFGHTFFVALIRLFGIRAAYAFLAFVVIYFVPFAPKATRAIWHYNRKILSYGRLRAFLMLFRHYYSFGQTLIDKVAINNGMAHKYHFEFENYPPVLEVLDKGAVVMIGAHVGCWEIGAQHFGDYAKRMNIVLLDAEYQRIKEIVAAQQMPYKMIAINEGSIESILRIKQAIDNGEYVCFQGDRYYDEHSARKVSFMGHETLFPDGPTLLAAKFRTPTVFYFAMRERRRRYRFIFHIAEAGANKKELMDRYSLHLEEVVRRYPQQWFNFYDVWRSA